MESNKSFLSPGKKKILTIPEAFNRSKPLRFSSSSDRSASMVLQSAPPPRDTDFMQSKTLAHSSAQGLQAAGPTNTAMEIQLIQGPTTGIPPTIPTENLQTDPQDEKNSRAVFRSEVSLAVKVKEESNPRSSPFYEA